MGSDAESTFKINVRTTADGAALKSVNTDVQTLSTLTAEAAQQAARLAQNQAAWLNAEADAARQRAAEATASRAAMDADIEAATKRANFALEFEEMLQAEAGAHGKAGTAAEGHAHSNSTLRLATRGANDAAFAITDLMEGNMLVAFHRAKFAAEDLGIAMKTAFAPTAIVVGLTLGIELLSHYVMASNEAGDATKKQGEKTEETKKQVFDLTTALRDQNRETAALLDPTVSINHAISQYGDIATQSAISGEALKSAFEGIHKATEELNAGLAARMKQIEQETTATKRLIDEKTLLIQSEIALKRIRGELRPDDAANQSARAGKEGELEKLDADAKDRAKKEAAAQVAAMKARAAANKAAEDAVKARKAFSDSGAGDILKDAAGLGIDVTGLNTRKDFADVADRLEKELSTRAAAGNTEGGITPDQAQQIAQETKRLRDAGVLFESAISKTRLAQKEDADARGPEAKYQEQLKLDRPAAEAEAIARKRIANDLAAIDEEQQKKQASEGRERAKKEMEEYLATHPQSAADASAAQQDLATKRTTPRTEEEQARNSTYLARAQVQRDLAEENRRIAVANAPNDAEAAGRDTLSREKEAQRRFDALPPNQRIAAEAQDAVKGRTNDGTNTGADAAKIRQAAAELAKGNNQQANTQLIVDAMKELIEIGKKNHEDTRRAEERFKQMQQEVKTLASQVKNSRQ